MLVLARSFCALYIATLLMQLGSTLLMSYLALRLLALGGATFWGGALMAANALGMVLGGRLGHVLINRVGHIRTYVACAGVIAAGVLGHNISQSMTLWLLLRGLVGLAMMCQLIVIESWLNEGTQSEQRGTVLALYMAASYIGMMSGQLALSLNAGININTLLTVSMAFALCLVPVALTGNLQPSIVKPEAIVIRRFWQLVPQSLVTCFASGTINGSFFGLAAVYATQQGMSAKQVGFFLALTIGAGLFAQLPMGWLSDRLPRASLIRGVAILLMIACLPLAFPHTVSFHTLLLFGAGIGCLQFCLYPLAAALANDNVQPELRVSLAGMLLTTFGLGACIGPLLAGAAMQHFGPSSLYLYFAVISLTLAMAVGQRKVTGDNLQSDAPVHQQPLPSGLASSPLVSIVDSDDADSTVNLGQEPVGSEPIVNDL